MSTEGPAGKRLKSPGDDDSYPHSNTVDEPKVAAAGAENLAATVQDPVGGTIPEEKELDPQAELRKAERREQQVVGSSKAVDVQDTKTIAEIIKDSKDDSKKASSAIADLIQNLDGATEVSAAVLTKVDVADDYKSMVNEMDLERMISESPKGSGCIACPRMKDKDTPHFDENNKQIFDIIFFDKESGKVTGFAMPYEEPPDSSIGPKTQAKLAEMCPGEGKIHLPPSHEQGVRGQGASRDPVADMRNALENPPGKRDVAPDAKPMAPARSPQGRVKDSGRGM